VSFKDRDVPYGLRFDLLSNISFGHWNFLFLVSSVAHISLLLLTIKYSVAKQYNSLMKTTSSMEWTSSILHHLLSIKLDV